MKKNLFFIGLLICLFGQAQSVLKTMKRLPDTGQNTSYTNTLGEDADFTINPPFYNFNGDGTVTDTVTGLMWQKTDGGEMTIESAEIYCDTLTLGGFTDWRLPNCHELFSILNEDRVNPAIDTAYFSLTTAEYWWSSQRQANDSTKFWVTNAGGGVGNHPKSETISAGGNKHFNIRAVRDVTSPISFISRFSINANGTIYDSLTTLTWQQVPIIDSLTWESALQLADTLDFAGYTDWRLPNIKELQSINDESLINPSLNQNFFSASSAGRYWSSTSLPNQITKAWYLDTHFGITTYAPKASKQMVLCVRNTSEPTDISGPLNAIPEVLIYPNPFSNFILINNTTPNTTFRLINLSGQVVGSGKAFGKVDLAELPIGLYIIELTNANQITHKSLLKN